jgi:hypothetical protein
MGEKTKCKKHKKSSCSSESDSSVNTGHPETTSEVNGTAHTVLHESADSDIDSLNAE